MQSLDATGGARHGALRMGIMRQMKLPHVSLPTVSIADSGERFPVHRIYCVGRNYADHAKEMGGDPAREPPFFFMKPADAVVDSNARLPYPSLTEDLHHEVELVIALGEGGSRIPSHDAARCIFGFAVGIDLTRRDLQAEAKKLSRPWDMAKGFDQSAPVGALTRESPPATGSISLSVDGDERQRGDLKDMIWKVPEIIATLSCFVTLAPGDLIFSGTPAGVGPIRRGQRLLAQVAGAAALELEYLA